MRINPILLADVALALRLQPSRLMASPACVLDVVDSIAVVDESVRTYALTYSGTRGLCAHTVADHSNPEADVTFKLSVIGEPQPVPDNYEPVGTRLLLNDDYVNVCECYTGI